MDWRPAAHSLRAPARDDEVAMNTKGTQARSALHRVLAVLIAAGALAAIGALSQVPYDPEEADQAWLRLSWRARSMSIDTCRALTAEELERLPAHMRRPEVCEGRLAPYRLRLEIDGMLVEDVLVAGRGAREDRPLYVFRELALAPGSHRIGIDFRLADHELESREGAPRPLSIHRTIELAAGQVALITHDSERSVLMLMGGAGTDR